jgi:hypothetical protein
MSRQPTYGSRDVSCNRSGNGSEHAKCTFAPSKSGQLASATLDLLLGYRRRRTQPWTGSIMPVIREVHGSEI